MSSSTDQVKLLFEFLHHVSSLGAINTKTNEDGFAVEFHTLKTMSADIKANNEIQVKAGSLAINKKKNRYKDILPFEKRRVELYPIDEEEGSDYINASYIADPLNKLSYIAAQGPNTCTVNDFWRMLWYHAIEIVIMACREVELGKSKCKNYWVNPGEVKQFGMITVSHVSEENITEDFIQRKMHIRCGDEDQMLTQLHYTGWPDHGVPSDVMPILNLIKKFRSIVPYGNDVPIVIHCSAGCGRTGALIGIDYAWALLESKKFQTPNQVYEIVRNMRLQRPAMVQTKDQYVLVYKAIFELVRQYLDEYQHDPSVAHLFNSTIKEKLSEITLPVYQNPSGIGEDVVNVELGGEINEDELLSASGQNTPIQTPKSSFELNNQSQKHSQKTQKPFVPKKPTNVPRTPEPLKRQIASLDSINENEKTDEKPIIRKYSPPTLPNKPLSSPVKLPTIEIKPRIERQIPIKPFAPTKRISLSDVNAHLTNLKEPDLPLTSSLPINNRNQAPIPLPVPYNKPKLTEHKLNNVVPKKIQELDKPDLNSNERPPIPVLIQPRIMRPISPQSPQNTETAEQASTPQSSITELLKQASLDQGTVYSDDEDDYWQPTNNQPVSQTILQSNLEKEKLLRSSSPAPLLPPKPFGANDSLGSSTELGPPIPLKSMHDKELIGSTEVLLSPPPSSVLVPVYQEDDYDVIGNIQKEMSPISTPEIYKSPSNEPVNGKPVCTTPYQPRGKGMGGIIASFKKTDLFKQKSSNPINSPTPNIPTSETLVTSERKVKIEYGPVGFGVRLAKPKGPRTTPFTWSSHVSECL